MNKFYITITILAFTFLLSCGGEELAKAQKQNTKLNKDMTELKVKNAELETRKEYNEKEIKRLTKALSTFEKKYDEVLKERDKLLTKNASESERLKMLNERKKELTQRIDELKKTREKLEKENEKIKLKHDKEFSEVKGKLTKSELELKTLKEKLEEQKKAKQDAVSKGDGKSAGKIDKDIKKTEKQIDTKEDEIAKLRGEIKKLNEQIQEQKQSYEKLVSKLKSEIDQGKIKTKLRGRAIHLSLMERVMFASGSTEITQKGKEVLRVIAKELKKMQYGNIYVEGHTDSDKVVAYRVKRVYPTNWEFSVIRAVHVVRFFTERMGIDPSRIIAAGRSRFAPIANNKTEKGKALNRRIEIYIMPGKRVIHKNEKQ